MFIIFVSFLSLIPSIFCQFNTQPIGIIGSQSPQISQNTITDDLYESLKCPQHWVQFQSNCYRFIRSPLRNRNDAIRNCQAYDSQLASINSFEEHGFIIYHLMWTDPQHRKWYISTRQQGPGYWINDGDNTQMINMDNAFLPGQENNYGKDFLVYR